MELTIIKKQKLIVIKKQKLGERSVNSVNGRELHNALEMRQDFSSWIKTQISRAGLEESVDYDLLTIKGEQVSGAKHLKEYILTTDAAKHIAMMSQSEKAKEVRNYFIEVEKQYIASLKKPTAQLTTLKTQLDKAQKEKAEAHEMYEQIEKHNVLIIKRLKERNAYLEAQFQSAGGEVDQLLHLGPVMRRNLPLAQMCLDLMEEFSSKQRRTVLKCALDISLGCRTDIPVII